MCPNYRRSLAVEKARVDFLSEFTMGLGVFTDLMMQLICEYSKLLFVVFVKWLFYPDCTN